MLSARCFYQGSEIQIASDNLKFINLPPLTPTPSANQFSIIYNPDYFLLTLSTQTTWEKG